jgi:hypothetical protein
MLFLIVWIILIPLAVWIILHIVSKRREAENPAPQILVDVCALCHEDFPVDELMEKEVGEYSRVYCFCGGCIEQLYHEYQTTRESANTQMGESSASL